MQEAFTVILLVGFTSAGFKAFTECWKSRDHRSNVTTICSSFELLSVSGGNTDQFAAALAAIQERPPDGEANHVDEAPRGIRAVLPAQL